MSSVTSNLYKFADFRLDARTRGLRRDGTSVPLTPKAFDVLLLLVQNAGRTVTKDELMKSVWPDSFVEESNLTQTIFMVRKALEETSERRYILNVQGQGYRFVVPITKPEKLGPPEEVPMPSHKAESVQEIQLQSRPPRASSRRSAIIASVTVALVLTLTSAISLWHSRSNPGEQPGKIMLAVLPFENFTGDPAQEYFS